MSHLLRAVLALLCLPPGAVLAVVGEHRLTAVNAGRRLRFHLFTPAHPPEVPPSAKALQLASIAVIALGALLLVGTTSWHWFAAWVAMVLVGNALPRGVVLARHNRRRGVPA